MTAIVHGLEREYGERVGATIENATKPANAARIRSEFGFRSHGLVIYGKSGELKEKLDGHLLQEPEIRSALERALASP